MASIEPSYDGPEAESIQQQSLNRWRAALSNAKTASQYRVSPSDLRGLLSRIPSFLDHIPNECKVIQGYSTWRNTDKCTVVAKQERPRRICLSHCYPVICKVSQSKNFQQWEKSLNNGLALMALGWAYILSASLAERQGLTLQYQTTADSSGPCTKQLQLEYATCHERTWWKSLISQGAGWKIVGRGSPWGLSIKDLNLEVVGQVDQSSSPPTAKQAASYLGRLCFAFDLGNQSSAGLAAAMSLPLHSAQKLWGSAQIELPALAMNLAAKTPKKQKFLPPEFQLISYYMTLSLSEWAIGPTLWSVFWEPQITCNFAGAWLGPIAAVLEPVLSNNDLELLAKVFSFTRAAPLWVGIALCGPSAITNCILPYLTKMFDYPFTLPSIDAAAWTGIPQSFLDDYYMDPCHDGTISRADVWRLRHDCHSEYEESAFLFTPPHGWSPFGRMKAEDVELEIRDHIHCSHHWEYAYWTWQPGSSTDTGFCKRDGTENCPVRTTELDIDRRDYGNLINYQVSKLATMSMFRWCSTQVERGFGGTIVERFRGHDNSGALSDKGIPDDFDYAGIENWLSTVADQSVESKTNSDETSTRHLEDESMGLTWDE
ncbi:unnamed protein product [Clonostachys rosea f. rosea IK726]|uniref:Uncharacterized protein n=1 Tax=Clonostachys rosea f. rosea IK726 TaxID=1349383 RepID=A0ACA9U0H8_BIOOC|nr:unnamed protein product [Clonostachys rosea f. rosea IK726]